MHTALYTKVQPYDVIGAVLQQELILCCGKLIETRPGLFQGTLVLRMGWLERAMEIYLSFIQEKESEGLQVFRERRNTGSLVNLSPLRIRQILIKMLEETSGVGVRTLDRHQIYTLNGCINRVPDNFYSSVHDVLSRCQGGLMFGSRHLAQLPTIQLVDPTELSFAHLVESFFTEYSEPRYRGLIIRLLSLLATVLKRNPELSFGSTLDMDSLVREAHSLFLKEQGQGSLCEDLSRFHRQQQGMQDSFLARAIVKQLLGTECGLIQGIECKLQ